jgi:hypothetical protein
LSRPLKTGAARPNIVPRCAPFGHFSAGVSITNVV